MQMIQIYGIKQCTTMKKAFHWLNLRTIPYDFHDYKKQAPSRELLEKWALITGWQKLLNTKGTTWRKLSETTRAKINAQTAINLMLEQPSLIKRPVIEVDSVILIGFDETQLSSMLENCQ